MRLQQIGVIHLLFYCVALFHVSGLTLNRMLFKVETTWFDLLSWCRHEISDISQNKTAMADGVGLAGGLTAEETECTTNQIPQFEKAMSQIAAQHNSLSHLLNFLIL